MNTRISKLEKAISAITWWRENCDSTPSAVGYAIQVFAHLISTHIDVKPDVFDSILSKLQEELDILEEIESISLNDLSLRELEDEMRKKINIMMKFPGFSSQEYRYIKYSIEKTVYFFTVNLERTWADNDIRTLVIEYITVDDSGKCHYYGWSPRDKRTLYVDSDGVFETYDEALSRSNEINELRRKRRRNNKGELL